MCRDLIRATDNQLGLGLMREMVSGFSLFWVTGTICSFCNKVFKAELFNSDWCAHNILIFLVIDMK